MVISVAGGQSGPHNASSGRFRRVLAVLSALAVVGTATVARADVIQTFYLENVNFADGGSATGSFTLDETAGQPYNVDIVITDPVLSASPLFGLSPIEFLDGNLSSAFMPSSNTVGIFSYDDSYTGIVFTGDVAFGTTDYALSTTGGGFLYDGNELSTTFVDGAMLSTSPVPEPASLALLGTSLAGLGWLRRRKANLTR